jgi:hypothetical protein
MDEQRFIGRWVQVYLKAPADFGNGRIVGSCEGTLATWNEFAIIPTDNVALVTSGPEERESS